jgi:hypothetical protein
MRPAALHLGTAARIAWSAEELQRLEKESLRLRVEDLVRGGYDREVGLCTLNHVDL